MVSLNLTATDWIVILLTLIATVLIVGFALVSYELLVIHSEMEPYEHIIYPTPQVHPRPETNTRTTPRSFE